MSGVSLCFAHPAARRMREGRVRFGVSPSQRERGDERFGSRGFRFSLSFILIWLFCLIKVLGFSLLFWTFGVFRIGSLK